MRVHRLALLVCILFGALSSATAKTAPAVRTPAEDLACRKSLSSLVAGGRLSDVPAACWRVGPLSIGMPEADLARVMGAPVQTSATPSGDGPGSHYEAKIYAFPTDWRSRLPKTGPVHLRFVEVLLTEGRVVGIANNPGVRVDGPSCRSPALEFGGAPAGFRRFQTFAGIRVGDTVQDVTKRFGRPPNSNRPGDWRSYLPAPIAFDVDPDTGRVIGFAIGAEETAVTTGADVRIAVERDARTCTILGLTFGGEGAQPARR